MPIFLTNDPQLNVALTGLAQSMFPDPATEMMAAYRRAGTMKLMQETEDLRSAAQGRQSLYGMMGDPGFNAADPNSQRRLYQQAVAGGPDMMKQAPQFFTGYTGAVSPGMDPKHLSQMQVSSGVVPYGGTQPGFELGQRTELGKAGIMAGAHVRGAQIAADQRQREFSMTPHNVGENQIGYVPQAGQGMFGGRDMLPGAAVGGGGGAIGAGPFKGTGMDQQASNIVLSYNQAKARGFELSDDMERTYAMAFYSLYGPKTELRAGPGGAVIEVPVQPQVPPGIAVPKYGSAVNGAPPMPLPQPGTMAAEPVAGGLGAPETPAVPQAAPLPTAPLAGQSGAPGAPPGAVPGVRTLVPGDPNSKGLPEHQSRNMFFLDRMRFGDQKLREVLGDGNAPGMYGFAMAAPKEGLWSTLATNALAPGQAKEFMTAAQLFLSAVLRKDTGAAAPFHEYPQYWTQFIPMPGDSQALLQTKAEARQIAMASIQRGLPPDQILSLVQSQVGPVQTSPAVVEQMSAMSRTMSPAVDDPRAAADALVGFGR